MASVLKVDKLDPQSGTALEIGTSGDTITVPTGAGLTVTDEVKTNKVSPATGTAFALGDSGDTFTVPSGATIVNSGTATGFGGGKILQFLSSSMDATDATTSATFQNVHSLDITPAATTSKIMVWVNMSCIISGSTRPNGGVQVLRDSTVIWSTSGEGIQLHSLGSGGEYGFNFNAMSLDSPETTSATTYELQSKVGAGETFSIFGGTTGDWTKSSGIHLMEIGV
jgi:hypothetical protein